MTELDELAGALAAFQAEVPVIPKKQTARIQTERGRDYSYTYADLASIAPVVMPLLAKHGLSFTALPVGPKGETRGPVLRGMLLHTSGQHLTGELPINGRTPQEIGSSLTYGRRYLLGCLTGVVTDDDDDGQLAQRAAKVTRGNTPPGDDPRPPVAPTIQRRPRPPREGPDPMGNKPGESPHGSPEASTGSGQSENKPGDAMTDPQRRALFAAVGAAFPQAGRDERLALCSAVIGRPIGSSNDMTGPEAGSVLTWLEDFRGGREAYSYDPETGLAYVWPAEPPPDEGA